MPQPDQNLYITCPYVQATSPRHDSKYPTSARPSGTVGYDNFGSGNFTSATGFTWQGQDPLLRSIVTATRPGGSGTNAMQLHYWGGPGDSISETRFDLSASYPEIYIRWWLRVPTNFIHQQQPSASGDNNKLFFIWMDGYSGDGTGASVGWEYWSDGAGGSQLAVHHTIGNNTGAGPHLGYTPFISVPADRGRWMKLIMRVKMSSGRTVSDGEIQMWRQWADEPTPTLKHNEIGVLLPSPSSGGITAFHSGYFLGACNTGFASDTDFLIDDVEFSVTPFSEIP
ncbi:hypothetical protein EKK58_11690 [Candidatus Dependentiae bacterium]|nr:MAG: hypothetical protein EKK58_11690 [Candidatus Dependentiae bacterium]